MIPEKCSHANRSQYHRAILFFKLLFFFLCVIILIFPNPEGHCAQVTLTWDPNSESDLAGYKIYYGLASGNYQSNNDVGNVTIYTQGGLYIGVTYYFAATAYNTQGLESGFSNEVVYTVPSCTYAISPLSASFSAFGGSGSVLVSTQAGCNWGTSAAPSWVTINSGSGTGNGTMGYTASPNTGTADRLASLTIAGNVFTITEVGLPSFTITASAGTGGVISPSGGVSVQSGANQTFTITPDAGYSIASVNVDGVSQGAITSYAFSAVNADHTIAASFTPRIYTLSVTNNGTGSGSVSTNPTGTSFPFGTQVTLTASPNANSLFSGWSGGCSGTTATCLVTMNSAVGVTATFNAVTNPPTVAAGSATLVGSSSATLNGTVNPQGLSTTYFFQWGRTTSYGNATAVTSAGNGTGNIAASSGISGLRSNTVYYYRLVATNSAGTTYGANLSFRTKSTRR